MEAQPHNKKLLNIFFTAGFPQIDSLDTVLPSLVEAGVDMVEIGLPFSDPLADGTTIQEAAKVALQNGMNLDLVFLQLAHQKSVLKKVPVYLMGYYNQFLQYGAERFLAKCQQLGIRGLIIPDLPMEYYKLHYLSMFEKYGIGISFLITPLTDDDRIDEADALSSGFVYAVSQASITGTKVSNDENLRHYLDKLRARAWKNKVLLGFGIQDRNDFETAATYLDGGIIGSAFIRSIQETGIDKTDIVKFVEGIRN